METIPVIVKNHENFLRDPSYYRDFPIQRAYRRHGRSLDCHSSLGPLQLLLQFYNAPPKDRGDFGGVSNQHPVGKDGFQVTIDVHQFRPNELTVKTVDNTVMVEGNHEERADQDGLISRHFIRKYVLPEGFDPQLVVSTLSSDGYLTIKAPPPQKAEGNERIVQIQQTGPAHLSVKKNARKPEAAGEKKK